MDRGAWWSVVHGVTKSQTRLSDFHFTSLRTREPSVCFVGGWAGPGKVSSWGTLDEAEMLEVKADLGPALMGMGGGAKGEPYSPRDQPFIQHISDPYVNNAVKMLFPLLIHCTHTHTHTHIRGKEASESHGQMRATWGHHVALTLGLVPRQGKSWSDASGRRMR